MVGIYRQVYKMMFHIKTNTAGEIPAVPYDLVFNSNEYIEYIKISINKLT